MGGEGGLSAEAGWVSAFGGGPHPRGPRHGEGSVSEPVFRATSFVWRCPPYCDVTSVYGWGASMCPVPEEQVAPDCTAEFRRPFAGRASVSQVRAGWKCRARAVPLTG